MNAPNHSVFWILRPFGTQNDSVDIFEMASSIWYKNFSATFVFSAVTTKDIIREMVLPLEIKNCF